jgi:proline iminopeptidase
MRLKSTYHNVYFQAFGNTQGEPWLFLHGGPGYFSSTHDLQYFDLKQHYVILFDQRGSGQSLPNCELRENNTDFLIQDILSILDHFNIKKVNLLGGSWGSTLALIFAIKHPKMVKSMVLRGIFLGRDKDISDLYKPSSKWNKTKLAIFDKTLGYLIKKFKIKDIIEDGFKILTNGGKDAEEFAKIWTAYEDILCHPNLQVYFDDAYLEMSRSLALMEVYYFKNHCFIEKNFILKNIDKIKDIKTFIVQGEKDLICPKNQALELSKKLTNSTIFLDRNGGHSSSLLMTFEIKKVVNGLDANPLLKTKRIIINNLIKRNKI